MKLPLYVKHIGRMAHILVPIAKIDKEVPGGTVRTKLYRHLEKEFGGCTENPLIWGMWGGIREAHVQITVSFKGVERIPAFLEFLAVLCKEMGEECLYLEMGEDTFLVNPQ